MPKLSPAELSRMKAEKDVHDVVTARKRAEEVRQQIQHLTPQQQQRLQQVQNVTESVT